MGENMKRYIKFLMFLGIFASARDVWSMYQISRSAGVLGAKAGSSLVLPESKPQAPRSETGQSSTETASGYHSQFIPAVKNMQPSPGVLSNLPQYRIPSESLYKKDSQYKKVHGGDPRVVVDYDLAKKAMNSRAKHVNPWYHQSTMPQKNVASDSVVFDVDAQDTPVINNQQSKPFNFGTGIANRPVGSFLGSSLGGSMAYRIPNGQSKLVEQKQPAKISEQQTVEQSQPALLMLTYDYNNFTPESAKIIDAPVQETIHGQPDFISTGQQFQSHQARVVPAQQVVVATPTQQQLQDELFHNYFTGRQTDNFSQSMPHLLRTPIDANLLQPKQAEPLMLTYDYTLSTPEPTKIGEQQNNLQPVENQPAVESQQALQVQQMVAPELVMPESEAQSLSNSNSKRPIINARQRRSPKKAPQFIEPVIFAENTAASAAPIELEEVPKDIKPGKKQLTPEEIEALKNSPEAQAKRRMRAENKKALEQRDLSDSKIIPDLNWKIEVEYEKYTQDQSRWAIVRMVNSLKNWILEKLNYRPSAAQKNLIDTKVQELTTQMNTGTMSAVEFQQQVQLLAANIQGMKIRGSLVDQNNVNSSDFSADFVA